MVSGKIGGIVSASPDAGARQREYYERTAEHYDAMHVAPDDEHGLALAAFGGLFTLKGGASILDIGAGTGRALEILSQRLPEARLVGIEPVAELRKVGHRRGIPIEQLIEGDATALQFPDDAFDFVIETGVLHHVANPARAVAEMVRVARLGVMISDSNKFGQGSPLMRKFKSAVRTAGLWDLLIRVQTKGKMHKWSEGDGVFYSYSPFDNLEAINAKFPQVILMNTTNVDGTDLRAGASHVMVFATN